MKRLIALAVVAASANWMLHSQEIPSIRQTERVPTTDVVAHDPVIIAEGETYYLFTTGPGVSVWTSHDMSHWTMQEPVFPELPAWTKQEVPEFNGHMWAPDISFVDGHYLLYYSVSSFGRNESRIGLATNKTLDRDSPDFEWVDRGIVVRSQPGLDNWNAIDPNLAHDKAGNPYLAYGSFWSGLKLAPLSPDRMSLADPGAEPIAIASRNPAKVRNPKEGYPVEAGTGAIEGPYIYRRGDYYYLFASVDYCCRGAASTYKMIYGRSKQIEGPYVDKKGVWLLDSGGSLLMAGDERWHGVGHNAICVIDGVEYVVFHGYDSETERGLPKLRMELLGWDEEGWPYILKDESSRLTDI